MQIMCQFEKKINEKMSAEMKILSEELKKDFTSSFTDTVSRQFENYSKVHAPATSKEMFVPALNPTTQLVSQNAHRGTFS